MKELKIEGITIESFKAFKGDTYNRSAEKYNTPTTIELLVPDVDFNKLKDVAASVLVDVTFKIRED